MNNHKKFLIDDFDNLRFKVFTIGYSSEGESVLGVIDDGDRHLYSFVVDSYHVVDDDNCVFNETIAKLKDLNITSIDAFVWTHPDKDHSTGIQELLSEVDKDAGALIFLPAMLDKKLEITDDVRSGMEYLFKRYNSGTKYGMNMVVKNQTTTNPDVKLTFKERRSGRKIIGGFYFLAPNGARLLRNSCVNKTFGFNRLSIMFSFRVNNFDYLFCGDLMGDDVQFLDDDFLRNIQFIKIPHHGSSYTRQLPQLLNTNKVTDVIATTTTFSKRNLPEDEIICMYKSIARGVYSTAEGDCKYGCVETDFNIRDLSCNVMLTGNAQVK